MLLRKLLDGVDDAGTEEEVLLGKLLEDIEDVETEGEDEDELKEVLKEVPDDVVIGWELNEDRDTLAL